MIPVTWPCPTADGTRAEEHALCRDGGRPHRLLIVPALFDEANRLRRLTVEVMRRLDRAGIDSFLPDLPGCNESLQPLPAQTPASWRNAMVAAADHFRASHVLAVRGGALVMPGSRPAWQYAPTKGATILRQLLRSRILASREQGKEESQDSLLATGLEEGLELSGFPLSADFLQQFQTLLPPAGTNEIAQDAIGGGGLWLRAEPGEDSAQADALAAVLATGILA